MTSRIADRPRSLYERLCEVFKLRHARVVCVYSNPVVLSRMERWQLKGDGPEIVVLIENLTGITQVYVPLIDGAPAADAIIFAVERHRKNGLRGAVERHRKNGLKGKTA